MEGLNPAQFEQNSTDVCWQKINLQTISADTRRWSYQTAEWGRKWLDLATPRLEARGKFSKESKHNLVALKQDRIIIIHLALKTAWLCGVCS